MSSTDTFSFDFIKHFKQFIAHLDYPFFNAIVSIENSVVYLQIYDNPKIAIGDYFHKDKHRLQNLEASLFKGEDSYLSEFTYCRHKVKLENKLYYLKILNKINDLITEKSLPITVNLSNGDIQSLYLLGEHFSWSHIIQDSKLNEKQKSKLIESNLKIENLTSFYKEAQNLIISLTSNENYYFLEG